MTTHRELESKESSAFNPFAPPEATTTPPIRFSSWAPYQSLAGFILGFLAGGVGLSVTCGTLAYIGFSVVGIFSPWSIALVAAASTIGVAVGVFLFAKVSRYINTRSPRSSELYAQLPAHEKSP